MDIDGDIPQKIEPIGKRRPGGVAHPKAVLEDSAENNRTRGRASHDATALQYVSKLLLGLCTQVALGDGFRQPAIEPDTARAFDRLDEGLRVCDLSVQSVEDKHADLQLS
jgi:hypothetical protein